MPKCVDLEKIICDTMLDMMQTKPFYNIKVTDLTKRANISRSTFYLYFNSVYEVIEKIENDFITGLINPTAAVPLVADGLNARTQENVLHEILSTISYLKVHTKEFSALMGPNGDSSFALKMSKRTRHCLVDALRKSEYSLSEAKMNLIAEYMVTGTLAYQRYAITHPDQCSDAEIAEVFWEINKKMLALLNGH